MSPRSLGQACFCLAVIVALGKERVAIEAMAAVAGWCVLFVGLPVLICVQWDRLRARVPDPPRTMLCAYCGSTRRWPDDFPVRRYAKCWECTRADEAGNKEETP